MTTTSLLLSYIHTTHPGRGHTRVMRCRHCLIFSSNHIYTMLIQYSIYSMYNVQCIQCKHTHINIYHICSYFIYTPSSPSPIKVIILTLYNISSSSSCIPVATGAKTFLAIIGLYIGLMTSSRPSRSFTPPSSN